MRIATVGYANNITEDRRRYIASVEPEASIKKWVFNKIAEGHFNFEQIMK